MIDRAARDQLSRNLRLLVAGRISNDKFEDSIPGTTEDTAIMAFADEAVGLPLTDQGRLPLDLPHKGAVCAEAVTAPS
jgi:hypothetical protein